MILFIYITKVRVSADVLTTGNSNEPVFTKKYAEIINPPIMQADRKSVAEEKNLSIANGKSLMNGDSLYYAYDAKNYRLYVATLTDKETVVLKALNPGDKNLLVSLNNEFFIKNYRLNTWKNGEKVTAEILNTYNSIDYEEVTVLGSCNSNILVQSKNGFHVVYETKLKRGSRP